jgi:hypothetical protein
MYQLMRFGLKEMTQCGAALRRLGVDASSFQDVAAQIVHFLYTQLVDEAGHPACALVRAFKTHPTELISPALHRLPPRNSRVSHSIPVQNVLY